MNIDAAFTVLLVLVSAFFIFSTVQHDRIGAKIDAQCGIPTESVFGE